MTPHGLLLVLKRSTHIFKESAMRQVIAFAVGALVLLFHQHHPAETWFVIKALIVGGLVLLFFRRK